MQKLAHIDWLHSGYAIGLVVFGLFFARYVSRMLGHALAKRLSSHQAQLIRRLVFYVLIMLFVFSALQELHFNLSVLLGAAGVLTVGLSFASQTAASNLVSGIFLLFEQPFKVGDVVLVNSLTGTVDSIDLLSTKLKTADNTRIRIPNETLMKSAIVNMSYFKTRRVDVVVNVAYDADLPRAQAILLEIAAKLPDVRKEPAPQAVVCQLGDSAIGLKLMVWASYKEYTALQFKILTEVKARFDEAKIELPFPQLTIHQAE